MRTIFLLVIAVLPVVAQAKPLGRASSNVNSNMAAPADKVLPLKGAARSNACADYGAGFVRVEGTNSCVKIGGVLSVDGVAAARGR
jgi:hypothetical protein